MEPMAWDHTLLSIKGRFSLTYRFPTVLMASRQRCIETGLSFQLTPIPLCGNLRRRSEKSLCWPLRMMVKRMACTLLRDKQSFQNQFTQRVSDCFKCSNPKIFKISAMALLLVSLTSRPTKTSEPSRKATNYNEKLLWWEHRKMERTLSQSEQTKL